MDSWRERYIKQLIKRGLDSDFAVDTYNAGIPHDQEFDPEDAANDELSYWTDD